MLDPLNFILHYGLRTANLDGRDIGPLIHDDSLITTLHESIHWRQLHGTSLGAFLTWLRHGRELDLFKKLRALPADRRDSLFRQRFEGQPIIALSEQGLPDPPIRLEGPVDPVEIMRCVFFDSFTIETLFYDPSALELPHAELEEIFSSVVADTAHCLVDYWPDWQGIDYLEIQEAYKLPREAMMRFKVGNPFVKPGQDRLDELTTRDILEAGAIANELMVGTLVEQKVYSSPGKRGLTLWVALGEHDRIDVVENSAWALRSAHGVALRHFFKQCHLDSQRTRSWPSVMAVCDYALNPPLPPVVRLTSGPPNWCDLYPPLRFSMAASAVRQIGPIPEPITHQTIIEYFDKISALTGLTSPLPFHHPLEYNNLPDFAEIVRDKREDTFFSANSSNSRLGYYHFFLWCQVELWRTRQTDLRLLVMPAIVVPELMRNDTTTLGRLLCGLAFTPPLQTDGDGELGHSAASSVTFGSWLAVSILFWGLAHDLMFGTGIPAELGFPKAFLDNPETWRTVRDSYRLILGQDPWNFANDIRIQGQDP